MLHHQMDKFPAKNLLAYRAFSNEKKIVLVVDTIPQTVDLPHYITLYCHIWIVY